MDGIVWIPSHLWFTFLKRRVVELSHVQKRLYLLENRPRNYALITAVLCHMLQQVGISPIVKDREIVRALADLRFNGIVQRFGCFFLHDLNLERGRLPGILKVDPPGIRWQLQGNQEAPNAGPGDTEIGGTRADEASPLAETWKMYCHSLNRPRNPRPIDAFVWDPSWLTFSAAEGLFCKFTTQFWVLLAHSAFDPLERPPVTLKEAMELWTLESVRARIKHNVTYKLRPSSDELQGAVPETFRRRRFGNLREMFFPGPETVLNPSSRWAPLFRRGYVKDFHVAIKGSRDEGESLMKALDGIFLNLQILPYGPGSPSNEVRLWHCQKSTVTLLVNSSYIQVLDRRIKEAELDRRGRGFKKLLSNKQLLKVLRGTGAVLQPKRCNAHRSGKAKNWRQPPAPWRGKRAKERREAEGDGDESHDEEEG